MRRLRLVPDDTKIPFFRYRWVAIGWSVFVLFATVVLLLVQGLNLGIDFKGGTLIEARTPQPADLALMRTTLDELGLGEVALQNAGGPDQVLIRFEQGGDQATQAAAVEQVKAALDQAVGSGIVYQRAEFVGPKVSEELLRGGLLAVGISCGGVLLYLWFRFEWQYGIGAIAALIHDVSSAVGLYALTGIEFNLTSIAAILTIVGYSLNDTVVIYDRVRENLRRFKTLPMEALLDRSINETLARTIATALTTLLALIALYVVGGGVIRDFTIVMIWGVVVGCYSTIYIAVPVLYYFNLRPAEPAATLTTASTTATTKPAGVARSKT